jgi:hypothetical protein
MALHHNGKFKVSPKLKFEENLRILPAFKHKTGSHACQKIFWRLFFSSVLMEPFPKPLAKGGNTVSSVKRQDKQQRLLRAYPGIKGTGLKGGGGW